MLGNTYRPVSVVVVVRFVPVDLSMMVIVAPGTTAPDGSETTPAIDPVDPVCAVTGSVSRQTVAASTRHHAAGRCDPPEPWRNNVVGRLITPPVGKPVAPQQQAEIRSRSRDGALRSESDP